MKNLLQRAAGPFVAGLVLLLYLNGCSPKIAEVKDASTVEGRLDVSVSPEQRQEFSLELQQGANGLKAARALYFLGLAEFQDGHFAEAGKYFQKIALGYPNSGWDRASIFMMAVVLERINDPSRALVQYQRLIEPLSNTPTAAVEGELSQESRKATLRLINGPLTEEEVDQLIQYPLLPEFLPNLYLKRVQLLVDKASASGISGTALVDDAFLAIDDFNHRFPDSPEKKEIDRLARLADQAVPVDKKALGLILPLGGGDASAGEQLRQGAQLAIDEANEGLAPADQIKLIVEDEGQTTQDAMASARKLILDSEVIGVIGPMSSDACIAVLPLANARRTPLLSPYAMRPDLASVSPYFFRNCLTLQNEAVAMADHALLAMKITRVAELYPDTPYGRALAAAFQSRVTELGGTVSTSISYTSGSSDFKDIFVGLGGVNPTAMKDADSDEKRDQEIKVESASTVLGKAILDIKADFESRSATAEAEGSTMDSYRPLTFPARLAIFDFGSSTSAAVYNAGRSFSDRFSHVLGQLDELTVLSPDEGLKRLHERALTPEALTPPLAAELGRAMDADFVLMGSVTELSPDWNYLSITAKEDDKDGRQARADIELFGKNQVFKVEAEIVDARTASVVAHAQFESLKMRPPLPNALGLQAIYIPGRASEAVQAASAMDFCDLKLTLLGGDLWKAPELLQNDNASSLDGALLSVGFFGDSTVPVVERFVETYKKRYAALPGQLAAQAYDAAAMMASLLRSGVSTREELHQALLGIHDFAGVSGQTSFDGRQDAIKRVPILKVNSVAKTFEQVQ